MKTSTEINELATALSKAQGELKDAAMDSVNPHFKNEYASLDSMLKEIRPTFSKYGLSFVQFLETANERFCLTTRLMHASGQWLEGELSLILNKNDMQGIGSATTYARRYSLQAIAGINQEKDDDGQSSARPQVQAPKIIANNITSTKNVPFSNTSNVDSSILVKALVTYSDKELPKAAGFQWDKALAVWTKRVSQSELGTFKFKVEEITELDQALR